MTPMHPHTDRDTKMIDLESDNSSSDRDTTPMNPDDDTTRRVNIAMGRCMLIYIACIIVIIAIFIVIRSA